MKTAALQRALVCLACSAAPVGDTRAQFSGFIRSEIARWGKAVRESGAKAE